MKYSSILLAASLLVVISALGDDFPHPVYSNGPISPLLKPSKLPPETLPHGHKKGLTKDDLDALGLSDAPYLDLLSAIHGRSSKREATAITEMEAGPIRGSSAGQSRPLFSIHPTTTIHVDSGLFGVDDYPDAESAVFASAADRSGAFTTTVAWMKWDHIDAPSDGLSDTHHIEYTNIFRGSDWVGVFSPPPLSHYHSRQADPTIAASRLDPSHVYLFGTDYDIIGTYSNGSPNFGANAIIVWTDPRATPSVVAALDASSDYFLDKPAAVVSESPATFGVVYCAFVAINTADPTATSYIYVYFGNGTSWTLLATIPFPYPAAPQAPALVVDRVDGGVWLFHADWRDNSISTWKLMPQLGYALYGPWKTYLGWSSFYTPFARGSTCDAFGRCIFQRSTLTAKQNSRDRTIAVVFHGDVAYPPSGRGGDTHVSHISFFRWNPEQIWWDMTKAVIPSNTMSLDHWNPSIDVDYYGNYLLAYYMRTNTTDLYYQVGAVLLTGEGDIVNGSETLTQAVDAGPFRTTLGVNMRNFGEYQGLSFAGDRWVAAPLFTPSARGDIMPMSVWP